MATGTIVSLTPANIGAISDSPQTIIATNINDFEAALLAVLNGMGVGQIKSMIFYLDWGGSPSGGGYSFGFLLKIAANVYKVSLTDNCTTGYYYSGAWHWYQATLNSFTP